MKQIPELERRFVEVRPSIKWRKLERFNKTFKDYVGIGFEVTKAEQCEEQKQKLLSLLDQLHKCAK